MGGTEVMPPVGLPCTVYSSTCAAGQTCLLQILVQAMTAQKDKERLLSILHAHGQQFLSAFDIPAPPKHKTKDPDGSVSEEEWTGCGSLANTDTSEIASNASGEHDGGV